MKKIISLLFVFCMCSGLFAAKFKTIQFDSYETTLVHIDRKLNYDKTIVPRPDMAILMKNNNKTQMEVLAKENLIYLLDSYDVFVTMDVTEGKHKDGKLYRVVKKCVLDYSTGIKNYEITVRYSPDLLDSIFNLNEKKTGLLKMKFIENEETRDLDTANKIYKKFVKQYCETF